jgi:transcriptional regulator with GAF, ATPase, and Fis domain/tetratricopeptide (TPR) repeat protein
LISEFAPGLAADRALRLMAAGAPGRVAAATTAAKSAGARNSAPRERQLALAIGVLDRAARALSAVHAQGFVHGDVKPSNLIVAEEGRGLKLIDLGFARAPGFEERPSGTPDYMAPELFRGESSPAADIYALGVTVWRLLAPPMAARFEASPAELLARSLADPTTSEPLPGWVPAPLVELLASMREPDRARRPADARELLSEIARLATALPGELVSELSGAAAESRSAKERALAVSALPFVGQPQARRSLAAALASGPAVALVGPEGSGRSRLVRDAVFALQLARAKTGEALPDYRVVRSVPARLDAGPIVWHVVGADGVTAEEVSRFARAAEVEPNPSVLVLERTLPLEAAELTAVSVGPLERMELEQLVSAALGASARIAPSAIDEAAAVSGGLAARLCRALGAGLAAGRDLSRPGDWRDASGAGGERAASVLPALSESARTLAELLCVSGGSSPQDRLQPCFETEPQLGEAIQLLTALGLASRASDGKLRLRPDVAKTLWSELGEQQRAKRAREVLGAEPAGARPSVGEPVDHASARPTLAADATRERNADPRSEAFLACAVGRLVEARRAFAASVQRALTNGDPALANELATEAHVYLGSAAQTQHLAALQADALRALGNYPEALTLLTSWLEHPAADGGGVTQAPAESRSVASREGSGKLRLLRAEIRRLQGDGTGATSDAGTILQSEDKAGRSSLALGASTLLARLALDAGDVERAEREARRVAGEAGDDPRGLRAAEVLSLALIHRGEDSQAQAVLEPALTAARVRGERAAEARLWSVQGSRQKLAGQLRSAAVSFGRAFDLADAAGEFHAAASFLVNLGTAQLDAGELGTALETLRDGARRLARLGRDRDVGRTLYNLALARQLIGDYPDALRVAERAEAAATRAGDLAGAAFACLLRAETAKEGGEASGARERLESLPDLATLPVSERVAIGSRAAALCAELADETVASAYLTRAEIDAEQAGSDDVELALARAACFGLRRESREAQREAERALALASERGEFAVQILALSAAARAAESRGDASLMRARLSELRAQLDTAALTLSSADRARLREVRAYRAALSALPAAARDRGLFSRTESGKGSDDAPAAYGGDARFRRLTGIAKRLTAETHPRRLYELLLDSAIDLTHAESGFLMLRDAEGELRVRAGRTLGERDQAERGISHSIVARVLSSGQALSTVDALRDERLSGASSVHALALRSVLVVPLRSGAEILGVIYLDDRLRPFAFGDDEVALLSDLADLASIALEAIERLRRERRAVRRLRATQSELARQVEAQAIELASWKGAKQLAGEHSGIVAHSASMRDTLELALRVARADVPVLIRGESGTGKELIAKAIHAASSRKDAPFISENCGAIPEGLLESTLFGHVKGAFTGADRRHHGLFETAHGGTLFLDEIGEMTPSMQVRLLRVLQDGEVRPIGGERATKVDVRVLSATHRDVDAMLERGGFRDDLFYRLAVVSLVLPPLRERSEDILPLVQHFLAKYAAGRGTKIDKRVIERLTSHGWPGNVRQLENEIRRALALASGDTLREEHFSVFTQRTAAAEITDLDLRAHVDELERKLIRRALDSARGNQTRAAELLGVSRFGLQKMLKRLFPTSPIER